MINCYLRIELPGSIENLMCVKSDTLSARAFSDIVRTKVAEIGHLWPIGTVFSFYLARDDDTGRHYRYRQIWEIVND